MFCDNCQDFGELPFRKKGSIWNYYQLMIWENLSIKENQQLRRIKEALTIKDLGVEVSQRGKQKQLEIMFIWSQTVPDAIKKFMANEEEGGKIGLEQAKGNP